MTPDMLIEKHKKAVAAALAGLKPWPVWFVDSSHSSHLVIYSAGQYVWPGSQDVLAAPTRAELKARLDEWATYRYPGGEREEVVALTYVEVCRKLENAPYGGTGTWLIQT